MQMQMSTASPVHFPKFRVFLEQRNFSAAVAALSDAADLERKNSKGSAAKSQAYGNALVDAVYELFPLALNAIPTT